MCKIKQDPFWTAMEKSKCHIPATLFLERSGCPEKEKRPCRVRQVTLEGLYDNDDCPWDDPTFDVSSATGLAQSVTVTVVSTCLNLSQLDDLMSQMRNVF